MISERLWDTFIWELKKQVEQGKYKKEDIATLVSLSETKSVLSDIQAGNQDYSEEIRKKIIDSGLIEEAKKINEESEKLKKYKKETEDVLEGKNEQIENTNKIITSINKKIEMSCVNFWNKFINLIIYILFTIIIILFLDFSTYYLYKLGWDNLLSNGSGIVSIVALIFSIIYLTIGLIKKEPFVLIPFLIKKRIDIENKLTKKCIMVKKNKLGILVPLKNR